MVTLAGTVPVNVYFVRVVESAVVPVTVMIDAPAAELRLSFTRGNIVPALAGLERPDLMRDFGLILENVDGAENPTTKFTMRSVPHCLSLSRSITPAVGSASRPSLSRTRARNRSWNYLIRKWSRQRRKNA